MKMSEVTSAVTRAVNELTDFRAAQVRKATFSEAVSQSADCMGRKECMESRPTAWVANIERVAPDTSTERQARATAPEHNETQKEEERPRDIVDANKAVPKPNNSYSFSLFVGYKQYILVFAFTVPDLL